jgi:hypothetical protein
LSNMVMDAPRGELKQELCQHSEMADRASGTHLDGPQLAGRRMGAARNCRGAGRRPRSG